MLYTVYLKQTFLQIGLEGIDNNIINIKQLISNSRKRINANQIPKKEVEVDVSSTSLISMLFSIVKNELIKDAESLNVRYTMSD